MLMELSVASSVFETYGLCEAVPKNRNVLWQNLIVVSDIPNLQLNLKLQNLLKYVQIL